MDKQKAVAGDPQGAVSTVMAPPGSGGRAAGDVVKGGHSNASLSPGAMEDYRRVKVIGKGAFGAAVLVRNGNSLFVMKVGAQGGQGRASGGEGERIAKGRRLPSLRRASTAGRLQRRGGRLTMGERGQRRRREAEGGVEREGEGEGEGVSSWAKLFSLHLSLSLSLSLSVISPLSSRTQWRTEVLIFIVCLLRFAFFPFCSFCSLSLSLAGSVFESTFNVPPPLVSHRRQRPHTHTHARTRTPIDTVRRSAARSPLDVSLCPDVLLLTSSFRGPWLRRVLTS